LLDGQPAERRGFLREQADAAPGPQIHGQVGDVFVVENNAPGILLDQPQDHGEGGGFTGPVRAEQADDFAPLNGHGDAIDHRLGAVALCANRRLSNPISSLTT